MIVLSIGAVVGGLTLVRILTRRKRVDTPPADPPITFRRTCGGNPDVTD